MPALDQQKRKTLKTIVTGTSCAVAPMIVGAMSATAAADCSSRHTISGDGENSSMNHATVSGLEIELDAIPDSDQVWVRLTNVTNQQVSVRHINPGVVTFGGQNYDVNSIFDGANSYYHGAGHTIDPDNSYSYIVAPVRSSLEVVDLPHSTISPFTATVTTPAGSPTGEVLTPRLVLA